MNEDAEFGSRVPIRHGAPVKRFPICLVSLRVERRGGGNRSCAQGAEKISSFHCFRCDAIRMPALHAASSDSYLRTSFSLRLETHLACSCETSASTRSASNAFRSGV